MHLRNEIAEQPAVIKRLLDEGRSDTEIVAGAIKAFDPVFACIAARGTSDNAARYAQYLFGQALRLPVMLATPSLHTVYATPANLSKALVIGISQSGEAEDVRAVLEDARGMARSRWRLPISMILLWRRPPTITCHCGRSANTAWPQPRLSRRN